MNSKNGGVRIIADFRDRVISFGSPNPANKSVARGANAGTPVVGDFRDADQAVGSPTALALQFNRIVENSLTPLDCVILERWMNGQNSAAIATELGIEPVSVAERIAFVRDHILRLFDANAA